jgi:hypothetical protein
MIPAPVERTRRRQNVFDEEIDPGLLPVLDLDTLPVRVSGSQPQFQNPYDAPPPRFQTRFQIEPPDFTAGRIRRI